jgi:AcrR family transcriptional regulator
MSNKPRTDVRNEDDPRVVRSTHALGAALVELMRERDFDAITVQHILDRAGVGRATFYSHFRNKRDVLHSGFERMFGAMAQILERGGSARLFPVEEFLDHVASAAPALRALPRAELDDLWTQAAGYIARIIEQRIEATAPNPVLTPALVGRMLAGALVEMVRWSQERPTSSRSLDVAFHTMAYPALTQARYAVVDPVARQA